MSTQPPVPYATTLLVRDACLCLHTQRAARRLARRFDLAMRPFGVSSGQFSLLMALNRPEPPRMREVADLLAMDRTTLTAALKPLERRGLVSVTPDPNDRRGRRLVLTAEGGSLLAAAASVWCRVHAEIEAAFPAGGPDALRQDLARLG